MRKVLQIIISIALMGLSLSVPKSWVSAQDGSGDLKITHLDAAEFPHVVVRFRLVDGIGRPLIGISNQQLILRDGGSDVPVDNRELRELADGEGVRLHFVLDAGLRVTNDDASDPNLNRARTVIRDFVNSTMIENLDEIAVTAAQRDGARPIIDFSGDGQAVVSAIEGYQPLAPESQPSVGPETPPPPVTGTSDPLSVLEEALEDMISELQAGGKPGVLALISPGLEVQGRSRLETMAARAREAGIPIYTVLTRNDATRNDFVDLADLSGGQFSTNVPPDEIYREIAARRRQYQLDYRSHSGESGTRQVEVLYDTSGTTLSDLAGYDVELQAANVVLESPTNGEIIVRRADAWDSDPRTARPTEHIVVARVAFPDNHDRSLLSAQLLVDGAATGDPIRNPGPRIELHWDLRGFVSEGAESVTVEVAVVDELGMTSGSGPSSVTVDLILPPDPTATAGMRPEDIAALAATLDAPTRTCFSPNPICDYLERPILDNLTATISLVVATISLLFAAVVWLNRGAVVSAGGRVGGAVTSFVERVTGRRMQATARAYLVVLEGDTNVGRSLEIFGDTPLGRSKQFAELLFQQNNEDSPISRLHCTIVDEEAHFAIRDEDSANGTYLNGVRIRPLEDEELHDGDEIELAQVERGGVKLLFQLAARSGGDVPDSARMTNPSLGSVFSSPEITMLDDFDDEDEF